MAKYSIVIPTYNHCDDLLKPCIDSILQYTDLDEIEIIVAANGCVDNTKEYVTDLGQKYPDNVKLVWFNSAVGFTKATNAGISAATGEYIIFLNNDILLLPQEKGHWLRELDKQWQRLKKAGVVGLAVDYLYGKPFVAFYCAMTSRAVIDDIGKLDESTFHMGGEDVDFCLRAHQAGYEIGALDTVYDEHGNKKYAINFPIYHLGEATQLDNIEQYKHDMEYAHIALNNRYNKMKYAVIIPTYNHCDDLLKPCVESIIANTNKPNYRASFDRVDELHLIVVANGCTDNTAEYLASLAKRDVPFVLHTIWDDKPLGYTKAVNKGIQLSISEKSDYTILMNNDVALMEFAKNNRWLDILRKPFEDYPDTGMVGTSKIVDPTTNITFIIFYMAIIKTAVFKEIGVLDEVFNPGYGEDIDFAYRLQKAGYTIRRVPVEGVGYDYTETFPLYHGAEKTMHDEKSNLKTVFGATWDEIVSRNKQILYNRYVQPPEPAPVPLPQVENVVAGKKYSVVIPTTGDYQNKLDVCISTMADATDMNSVELIIIANGVTPETKKYLSEVQKEYPSAKVLIHETQLGFPKAVNAGISMAEQEYVILLNDDVVFLPQPKNEWINNLEQPFITNEKSVGITGLKMLGSSFSKQDYLMFFCVMLSSAMVADIGLLDENFSPAWVEDEEYCLRASLAGYLVLEAPASPIYHKSSATLNNFDYKRQIVKRNRHYLLDKYFPNDVVHFIVPTYNRHDELRRALNSIEQQTYEKIRVFVCADGHDPEVQRITEEFQANSEHKMYTYLHLPEHEGLLGSKPRMMGIDALPSTGVVCFLDDDNIIYPTYVEKLFNLMYSDSRNIISYCVISHSHSPHNIPAPGHVEGLFQYSNIDTLNVMIKCDVAKLCKPKWQHIKGQRITHDIDFISECGKHGKSAFLNELLAEHLMSKNKVGGQNVDTHIMRFTDRNKEMLKALEPLNYQEIFEMNIYGTTVPELQDSVVVDIGAHYGFFAMYAAECGAKEVLCFEPDPNNFSILQNMASEFPTWKIYNEAVLDGSVDSVNIVAKGMTSNIYEQKEGTRVKCVSLTEVVNKHIQPNQKAVLKIDAEGSEFEILLNTPADILNRFERIYVEIHDKWHPKYVDQAFKIFDRLKSLGFVKTYDSPPAQNLTTFMPLYIQSHKFERGAKRKPKVYDCFIFHNELDLLDIRFNTLYPYVDRFVLVEARFTHQGNPKPLVFDENKERYSQFMDKITHIVVDEPPTMDSEYVKKQITKQFFERGNMGIIRERYQRDMMVDGWQDCEDDDIIIISDADEIISPKALKEYDTWMGYCALGQRLFYYRLNCEIKVTWTKARIMPYSFIKDKYPSDVRFELDETTQRTLPDGGWHFSYLYADPALIADKIKSFCHYELNTPEITDVNRIKNLVETAGDLYNRPHHMEYVQLDNGYPEYVLENKDHFTKIGLLRPLTYTPTDNDLLLYHSTQNFVYGEIFKDDAYLMKPEDFKNATILDIGANVGLFTLKALSLGAVNAYCFEPSKNTYHKLRRLTKYLPAVRTFNTAVSDGALYKIHMNEQAEGVASTIWGDDNGEEATCIPMTEAVTYVDTVTHPYILKLDCEGSEYEILLHTPADVFKDFDAVYIEMHDEANPNFMGKSQMLLNRLQDMGFTKIIKCPQFGNFYPDGTFKPHPVYTYQAWKEKKPKAMVYDCFTFFDELDILELRLNILNDVVDKFVLVESTKTHSGQPKPLYYAANSERFAKFRDKIIHLVYKDPMVGVNPWEREAAQRNSIKNALLQCKDDDIIIVSDVDEIPDPNIIRNYSIENVPLKLKQRLYYYYLNGKAVDAIVWLNSRICRWWQAKTQTMDAVRRNESYKQVDNAGWHFSYLGGVDKVVAKLEAFAHQEFNNPHFKDKNKLRIAIDQGKDIFDRNYKYVYEEIDDTYPEYIRNNKAQLKEKGLIK